MKIPGMLLVFLFGAAAAANASTKTTTTNKSSLNPSIYGENVTFTATVTPPPPNGELITFEQGTKVLGTGSLTGGSATFTISTLTTGSANEVKAVYGGDSTYAGSTSSSVAQVVDAASTTTALVSSQNPANVGQSVTFTASLTSQFGVTVTGSVAFYSGSKKLGTVTLSSAGTASYSSSTLAQGSDSITATYDGNKSFLTSTSSSLSESIENGTYSYLTMVWDGITRDYEIYQPAVLPKNPPLVMMLHGTSYDVPPTNPSTIDYGWSTVANAYEFILLQPASTYDSTTHQWNWNSYFMDASFPPSTIGTCTSPPATSCPDDAGFIRQLILNMEESPYSINSKMIYVAGFSSGAQMTERVGVEVSDLVAAIVPGSGQMEGQQAAPPPVLVPGNALAPISVQEWHGTEDNELPPCDYGTTVYSAITYYLDTVDDTFNYWVGQNKCTVLQTTQTLCTNGEATPGLSGNTATGCTGNNIEVQFNWEEGLAHGWKSGNDTTRWLFMAAHPKSSASKKSNSKSANNDFSDSQLAR